MCRTTVKSGEVRISSSYDATKLWFNHDSPEFSDFKKRDIQTPVKSISSTSMLSCGNVANDLRDGVIQVHSIAELYENTEIGEFWVAGKITGIETTGDWFFKSCLGCYKKLSDNNGEVSASLLLLATPAKERYGRQRVASRRDGGYEPRLQAVKTKVERPAGDRKKP
nr:replication protein A 70 kDa DNA-binding subunit B-like [Ipomoea batatas]